PVEREAPRVPQAERRHRHAAARGVDPEQLAELRRGVLRAVLGVAAGAAVAHADPELAVGPELELAAVVVRVGLRDEQKLPRRARDRASPVGAVLDDARVAVPVGVVDVEEPVLRVAGVEGDREKPLLPAAQDEAPDVEERLGPYPAALEDDDPP